MCVGCVTRDDKWAPRNIHVTTVCTCVLPKQAFRDLRTKKRKQCAVWINALRKEDWARDIWNNTAWLKDLLQQ